MTFDPLRLLRVLAEHRVDFVLIGQAGAVLHGAPAVTLDIDIVPMKDLENAERLAEALNGIGARHLIDGRPQAEWPRVEEHDFLGWQPLSIRTDLGPIDVVPDARGVGDFTDWAQRAERFQLEGFEVLVANLDDIIASKEALGRPKDRAQLPALYATRAALRRAAEGADGSA